MFVPRSLRRKEASETDRSRKPNFVHGRSAQLKKLELVDERASACNKSLEENKAISAPSVSEISTSSAPVQTCTSVQGNSDKEESDDEEEIVSYTKNQRWPTPGEPVCVVCGRYGAYIVDQTDNDVCSLECKARHLKDLTRKKAKELLGGRDLVSNEADEIIGSNEVLTKNTNSNDDIVGRSMAEDREFNFHYKEHPFISELSVERVNDIRENLNVKVKGDNVSKPILEFKHCQLRERLDNNLAHFGYVTPTPVQMQVIPVGLNSRDVMACAQTGSGKTAAFLVPMIQKISSQIGKWDTLDKHKLRNKKSKWTYLSTIDRRPHPPPPTLEEK